MTSSATSDCLIAEAKACHRNKQNKLYCCTLYKLPHSYMVYCPISALCCTTLRYTALHCATLRYTALRCATLVLHCTVLHCTSLLFLLRSPLICPLACLAVLVGLADGSAPSLYSHGVSHSPAAPDHTQADTQRVRHQSKIDRIEGHTSLQKKCVRKRENDGENQHVRHKS